LKQFAQGYTGNITDIAEKVSLSGRDRVDTQFTLVFVLVELEHLVVFYALKNLFNIFRKKYQERF